MIGFDEVEMRTRVEELRLAEESTAAQLVQSIKALEERHQCPDPVVSLLAGALEDLQRERLQLQRAIKAELAG